MSKQVDTAQWWSPILRFAARTDVGMRRTNNQDSFQAVPAASRRLWRERGHLFIVADGMGAHAAGELASRMATEIIAQSYLKRLDESPYDALKNAMLDAHQQIKRQGNEEDAFRDMGTTADALALLPEGALVAHVGDSRVYRFRAGVLEQLTFDHSLVWEIRRSGRLNDNSTPSYIPKNVITRSLGPTNNPTVDLEGPFPTKAGDIYLLCSDGLSGQIEDGEMAQILSLFSPSEAAESLINLANLRGGPDNITLVIANILGVPELEEVHAEEKGYEKRPPLSAFGWGAMAAALGVWLVWPIVFFSGVKMNSLLWILWGALAAALTGLFLYVARKTLFRSHAQRSAPNPFGHGPYTQVRGEPTENFAKKLLEIFNQLREAVKAQQRELDHGRVDELEKRMVASTERGDYGDALWALIKNINLLMGAIQRKKRSPLHRNGRVEAKPNPERDFISVDSDSFLKVTEKEEVLKQATPAEGNEDHAG